MFYFVPTPIGNIRDITLRALDILQEVDIIYAEDTRSTAKLLKHFNIKAKTKSFHSYNEHHTVEEIIDQLKSGVNIALVSDAGTPGISDPGFLISRAMIQANLPFTCLPGSTALIPALVMSGLPMDRFCFEGFLPHKKGRQTRLKKITALDSTVILYESPYRVKKLIEEIIQMVGEERQVCIVREISKIYEQVITRPVGEIKQMLDNETIPAKGEFVVVMNGI